jgi:hypothetical protein
MLFEWAIDRAVAILTSRIGALITPTSASAKAEFAARTGLPCGQCHMNPAVGGKFKAFGQKFKAGGFKLKK